MTPDDEPRRDPIPVTDPDAADMALVGQVIVGIDWGEGLSIKAIALDNGAVVRFDRTAAAMAICMFKEALAGGMTRAEALDLSKSWLVESTRASIAGFTHRQVEAERDARDREAYEKYGSPQPHCTHDFRGDLGEEDCVHCGVSPFDPRAAEPCPSRPSSG